VSNNLLTISYITNEGLLVLENNLVFADKVDRQYSDEFAIKGAKIGATCNVRRPPRYLGTFGPPLNVEDTNETYIPVTLNYQFHVDVQFTMADLLLSMDLFKTRVLKPMMATVSNRIDSDGMYFAYQNTAQAIGTPGVTPSNYLTFAQADAQLSNEAIPEEDRCIILSPLVMASAVDGVKGLFNPQAQISEYLRRNMIAKNFANMDWYKDQNVVSFTTGNFPSVPTLKAVTQPAIISTGWAQAGFLQTTGWGATGAGPKVGDIISIAGVYPANPQSRTQYGSALKQFVVLPPGGYTQNPIGAATPGLSFAAASGMTYGTFNATTGVYTSDGGEDLSLYIGEVVITGGQFQNVAVPAGSISTTAALSFWGTTTTSMDGVVTPQGIAMHKLAFALAFADLPLPRGVQDAARANDSEIGMSMRMVSQYTINNDALPTRCDVLYGYSGLYRNAAVRVVG
jgi:hypothetical protein